MLTACICHRQIDLNGQANLIIVSDISCRFIEVAKSQRMFIKSFDDYISILTVSKRYKK